MNRGDNMLYEKIIADLTNAMKAQDKFALGVLRMLKSALQMEQIAKKSELTDIQVMEVIKKQIKQRKDSIEEFQKFNRLEEVDKLKEEIKILSKYLPEQLSDEEIDRILNEIIAENPVASMKDMGKIINLAKERMQARADMAIVSKKVKEIIMKNL